ncbi:MAG TPA: helix-turn-helix transcriptional regulator [Pseudonocardiaceae bacterium]|nr:helix-turn-helix transcriptional regulator [Pseudonocardiaceae bacterium]
MVTGLAGISAPYLSQLENGHRGFNRRGLIEDLADALSCSVMDLTGQPYLPPDRASADAIAAMTGVSVALHDSTLDDVPDIPTRPVDDLVRAAAEHSRTPTMSSSPGSAG